MFQPLRKYAVARGRARRAEYWYFFLFVIVTIFVLSFVEVLLGINTDGEDSILANLFYLAVLIPTICLSVRRLHDLDQSGWWILLQFIPLINIILFIYLGFWKGTDGDNRFGPDPLNEFEMPDAKVFE